MHLLIQKAIEAEAKKRLSRVSRTQYYLKKYRISFEKRTGKKAKTSPNSLPAQWAFHKHFDPRYCLNHSKFIANGIWTSLLAGIYEPVQAYRVQIPKPSGGFRFIDAFSVPDAAIAKVFLNNLRSRNGKIFSDSSYAYQLNKAPLDAIIRLKSLLNAHTIFISQYDFSKYFDSIEHEYLKKLIDKDGPFLTTHMERHLLQSILTHSYVEAGSTPARRDRGVPQGNSLSLFLANVAAHPLDCELARLNGSFARFADDSIIVNDSYEDALKCASAFQKFSKQSGVKINQDKSSGIRIFSDKATELTNIAEFDFLGYCFRPSGLHVSGRAIAKIKKRCGRIIYNHLLLYPRRMKAFNSSRIGPKFRDWELVTCINELRNYIYGGRSQSVVDKYLAGRINLKNFAGASSYFCLVEAGEIFRELDGWLVNSVYRAYRERRRLFKMIKKKSIKEISEEQICTGDWYTLTSVELETKMPSFFTAWRAARMSWSRHGLGGVDVQGEGYSYL